MDVGKAGECIRSLIQTDGHDEDFVPSCVGALILADAAIRLRQMQHG